MVLRATTVAVMLMALACSETSLAAPDAERLSPAAQAEVQGTKVAALPQPAPAPGAASRGSSVCELIDAAAAEEGVPSGFFTRLIWKESSFRVKAVSRVGAQGIAQFMPATAAERGLVDPFDPHQAIPASASLLKDLVERFGNLGLAAAAYNAGPRRVAEWLSGSGGMPGETRAYVAAVTGHPVEHWRAPQASLATDDAVALDAPCLEVAASLRASARLAHSVHQPSAAAAAAPAVEWQPWGVQLAGSFSEERALTTYRGLQKLHPQVLGDKEPLILRQRNASRGRKPMVNVRVPVPTRTAAEDLCQRLRGRGGACVVLKN